MKTRTIGLSAFATGLWLIGCGGEEVVETPVEEGTRGLPEVHLDADALAMSDVALGEVTALRPGGLRVTGTITYDQDLVSHVGPKTAGRITDLRAELGSRVTGGSVLARLESPEVGTTRAELVEAEALLMIAQETFDRETRLEAQGISSRREVLEAEAQLRTIEARRRSAEERLRLVGASLKGAGGNFDVIAPYDGVVVERHAGRGEVVGPSDQLFTIADLTTLWIELDIFERDVSSVSTGHSVALTTAAWPGRIFPARIDYVADILDFQSRTVRARVVVENLDGALKPGMFATAMIHNAEEGTVAGVPRDAVQNVDGNDVVWIPGDEEGEFQAVLVLLGAELPGAMVTIERGLLVGDRIVVTGAFTLKAELAKGDFGDHGH